MRIFPWISPIPPPKKKKKKKKKMHVTSLVSLSIRCFGPSLATH